MQLIHNVNQVIKKSNKILLTNQILKNITKKIEISNQKRQKELKANCHKFSK